MESIITLTDSYKLSHFNQYPHNTDIVHSYLIPRSTEYDKIVFFGLHYYIKKYLKTPITQRNIDAAEKLATEHGCPFNKSGWEYILHQHKGKLPIKIRGYEDGTILPSQSPLAVVENLDVNCFWLTSYLETLILKTWYPTTIATRCYNVKQMITHFYQEAGEDIEGVDFAYHNFGDRGATSVESAAIGGVAHLTQFKGTDNFNALVYSKKYYQDKYKGYSIPATEHSTVTSWGEQNEFKMIENLLETYKNYPLIACVSDSYDIYKTTDFLTSGIIKNKIESKDYPTFCIRPDSGEPIEVLERMLHIMAKNDVSYTINNKGYKLFDKYRILWGDGITPKQIENILLYFINRKMSPKNFAFGSGGDLMQNCNRDTLKFAFKCSAIFKDKEWHSVYKRPITDLGKTSFMGGRIDTSQMKILYSI